jgi:peptidoglycan/LPS O-acetylase OafA/YrhL
MATEQHRLTARAALAGQDRAASVLRWILAFAILSTGLHFTHNFVEIEQYPDSFIPDAVVQVAIVLSWPLFTGLAVYAYRLYSHGQVREAHPVLVAYGLFCMVTLGHFIDGSPDIAPFWFATIFTDTLAGLAVLAFTITSMRSHQTSAA